MNKLELIKSLIKAYPNKSLGLLLICCVVFLFLGVYMIRASKRKKNNISKFLGFATLSLALISLLLLFVVVVPYQQKKRVQKIILKENIEVHTNTNLPFGIDISHYQGKIDWSLVSKSQHPIEFIFIRATMGINGIDLEYERNLRQAIKYGFLVGSYHFYRPDEDPEQQFENFKNNVTINTNHLLPVLDVEWKSSQGMEHLTQGVKVFLDLVEGEYGVKPIIYSGLDFWEQNLENNFSDYPLWIAAYSRRSNRLNVNWNFHQFSETIRVIGIHKNVDGNYFNGDLNQLKSKFLMP
jgi:lysozyme